MTSPLREPVEQSIRTEWTVAVIILVGVVAALFATAPRNGDFYWSDAPRHALNGAFLLDLLRDLPLRRPVQWAYDYYLQYPALSILFYPPLFYVLLVPVYAVLGVSHAAALILGAAFNLLLGLATYALARRVLTPMTALAVAIAAVVAPEMAFWSRMVMLDVPAIALMTWSIVWFLRFCDHGRTGDLAAFLFLFACALYTKQLMAFVAPPLAIYLLCARGWRFLAEPRTWIATLLTGIALVPLVAINLRFAAFNFEQAGAASVAISGGVIGSLSYYLQALPRQLTWPFLLLALLGMALLLSGRLDRRHLPFHLLLLGWVLFCYLMFTPIALKSPRFTLPFIVPLMIFGGLAAETVGRRLGGSAMLAAAAALLAFTLTMRPVHDITGIRLAADAVARVAPLDSNVLFSGKHDGAFVFDMRAYAKRSDLSVLRADKALVRVRVGREFGLQEADIDEADMLNLIRDLGLKTIVHHEGFWTDVPVIARFERLLSSPAFTEVARVPMAANFPTTDATVLRIYKPNFPVADGRPKPKVELGITGDSIR